MRSRGRPKKPLAGPPLPVPLEFHWTLAQIAVSHQLTPAALMAMIRAGELRAIKSGREWRVSDAEYRDWLRRCQYRATSQEAA